MNKLATLTFTLILALTASTVMADRLNIASTGSVQEAVERLTKAAEAANIRIFSTVDFAAGAASVGVDLRPTTVVIFGSPKIGAQALTEGQTMALHLPLRILFFEDAGGQTWATYEDPSAIALTHGLAADNPAVLAMRDALARFANIAVGK